MDNAPDWQLAVERMGLYLKSMQLAPEDQLGLALAAIRRVRGRRPESTAPVAECLHALWQILKERSLDVQAPEQLGDVNRRSRARASWQIRTGHLAGLGVQAAAHPPIRRQTMISAPMELAPWRQSALSIIDAVRQPVEHLLYRNGVVLGRLIMLFAMISLK